jgi:hypothetical protein
MATPRRETIRLGPIRAAVDTPEETEWDWIRRRYELFREAGTSTEEPDLSLSIGFSDPTDEDDLVVRTGLGEVRLTLSRSLPLSCRGSLGLTPRALGRAVKRAARPAFWRDGRRELLYRHAFEHPLTAMLDGSAGYATLHAATVSRADRALMFLGTNGAGKTTAALQLVRAYGFDLIADNFSPCDGRHVLGFPGLPRPKPSGPSHLRMALPSPRPRRAKLEAVVFLAPGEGTKLLRPTEASRQLNRYVTEEREDHRDTALFRHLRSLLCISTSAMPTVIERLGELPVLRYDWRQDPLTRALGLASLGHRP